jgi:hypothetical protein
MKTIDFLNKFIYTDNAGSSKKSDTDLIKPKPFAGVSWVRNRPKTKSVVTGRNSQGDEVFQ